MWLRSPAPSAVSRNSTTRSATASGQSATLVPLDLKDYPGIDRLGVALHERFGRLDVLVGNAGILGPALAARPRRTEGLGRRHGGQCHRQLAADLRHGPAAEVLRCRPGGVRFVRGRRDKRTAYWGPYAVSKAALETLARTYAAETVTTPVRVNLFTPGPVRTRMRAQAMPGEDPMTLETPGRGRRKDRRIVPAQHAGKRDDLLVPQGQAAGIPAAGVRWSAG